LLLLIIIFSLLVEYLSHVSQTFLSDSSTKKHQRTLFCCVSDVYSNWVPSKRRGAADVGGPSCVSDDNDLLMIADSRDAAFPRRATSHLQELKIIFRKKLSLTTLAPSFLFHWDGVHSFKGSLSAVPVFLFIGQSSPWHIIDRFWCWYFR